jgi:TRAP-type C4-dicarboxylate transport system permease small subunit
VSKILALGGGALVAVACFLPLLSLSVTVAGFTGTGSLHATDLTAGKVALVLAFLSVLLAVIDVRGGEGTLRRPAAALAIVGAAIVVYKSWKLMAAVNAAGTTFAHVSMGIAMWIALVGAGLAFASDFVGRG